MRSFELHLENYTLRNIRTAINFNGNFVKFCKVCIFNNLNND